MSDYKATVYKDKKNDTYRVSYTYISPDGKKHRTGKRGFKLKKDANAWVDKELPSIIKALECRKTSDEIMTMGELIEEYLDDFHTNPEYKESTYLTKKNIINTKILPYMADKVVYDIKPNDIRIWRNKMIKDAKKELSLTYVYSIEAQLTAILNYAVEFHDLPSNPYGNTKKIGKKNGAEKTIWTLDEYNRFIKTLEYDPVYYYAFQVLFWCGLRRGEMMALTPADINFEENRIRINKSYRRINGQDCITTPKTLSGIRTISIPKDLAVQLKEYIDGFYNIDENARIFPVTQNSLYRKLKDGIEATNLKKITIHGLRHSNISMIANLGYSSVDIAYRAGHSKTSMTAHYTHRYEGTDKKIANALNEKMTGGD